MNIQLLAKWAQTAPEFCIYDPETLGLYNGERWLDRDEQAEFFEWCGDPMYTLRWRVINVNEAGDILNNGGYHWILFKGEQFDRHEFGKWSDSYPTESDASDANNILADIDNTQAVQFWCERSR